MCRLLCCLENECQENDVKKMNVKPQYKYGYSVFDPHTLDVKSQWEHRDGDFVKGAYNVLEADGSMRIVEYISDKDIGFRATVKKIPFYLDGLQLPRGQTEAEDKYSKSKSQYQESYSQHNQQPISQEPLHHQLIRQQPIHQQPIRHEFVYPQLITQQPMHQQSIRHEPVHTQLMNEQPIHQKSIKHEPVHPRLINQQPIHHQSIKHEPVHPQLINQQPIHQQSIRHEPVHPQLINQQPIHQQPKSKYSSQTKHNHYTQKYVHKEKHHKNYYNKVEDPATVQMYKRLLPEYQ
ncbi:hypothetical protein V9T40_003587 [Parthenolecanium corni]|uniref:Uncharacterized protein n=1 Tax=Parthenolecanium corni TaxID=536013 RepID=A0AAN9Y838_9HEMI